MANFKKRYKMTGKIADGGQASVMNAIELLSYQDAAIKVFKKKDMNQEAWTSAHFEYNIMSNFKHPNIM